MTPLGKYIWLIQLLQETGGITYEEINQRWLKARRYTEDENMPILKRTFHNHIKAIREEYGIQIECGPGYKHYIANENKDILPKVERLSTLNMLHETMLNSKLQNSLYIEDYNFSFDNITTIMEAINTNHKVRIENRLYDQYKVLNVAPYQLHYLLSQWFLLGETDEFGLMRIPVPLVVDVYKTDALFKYPAKYTDENYRKLLYGNSSETIRLDVKIMTSLFENYLKHFIPMSPFQQKVEYKSWVTEGNAGTFPSHYYIDDNYAALLSFKLPKTPFALGILKDKLDGFIYQILNDVNPFSLFTEEQYEEAMSKPFIL